MPDTEEYIKLEEKKNVASICPSFSSLNEHDLAAHAVLFTYLSFFFFSFYWMQCCAQYSL